MTNRRIQLAPAKVDAEIEHSICVIRGQKVLLDSQLAQFYGTTTGRLIEQVSRNRRRFPEDFMFRLSAKEWAALRSQSAISNADGRGGRRYAPYAFTELGVAMLSSVLRSPRAVEMNIQIMRAFVRLRQMLAVHRDLADRLAKIESRMQARDADVNQQFQQVFDLLNQLFNPPHPPRKRIGFDTLYGS